MEARRSSAGLVLVQGVLLALCAASLLVFASWLLGYNGLGLFADRMPDRLMEANAQVHEPVLVEGRAGIATTAAANTAIGVGRRSPSSTGTAPPSSTETRRTCPFSAPPRPSTPPGSPYGRCPRWGSP